VPLRDRRCGSGQPRPLSPSQSSRCIDRTVIPFHASVLRLSSAAAPEPQELRSRKRIRPLVIRPNSAGLKGFANALQQRVKW